MKKWEYNAIDHEDYLSSRFTDEAIDNVLDSFGKDGWELVGWYGIWFIFKREIEQS